MFLASFGYRQIGRPNLRQSLLMGSIFLSYGARMELRVELRCRSPRELGSEPRSSDFELLWSLDLSLLGDPMELIWTTSWSLHPGPQLSSAQLRSAQPGSAQLSPAQPSPDRLADFSKYWKSTGLPGNAHFTEETLCWRPLFPPEPILAFLSLSESFSEPF